MKQPHEGVTGTRRDDFLLSLDDRAVAHRDVLIAMATHLQRACLVGNPAPIVQRMNERIRKPQVGDLVVESSVPYSTDPDHRLKGFGVLIEHRVEWWETDEQWSEILAEGLEEERTTDHAWYVQYGPEPGDVCRWVNCSFTALPTDPRGFDSPLGSRDDQGVTITRGDMVAGLADSGFQLRAGSVSGLPAGERS